MDRDNMKVCRGEAEFSAILTHSDFVRNFGP